MRTPAPTRRPTPLLLDAGWPYVIAGAAIIAATVLVPAHDDLARARWLAGAAQARVDHEAATCARYADYLDALVGADPTLVADLAATHLNLAPEDRAAVLLAGDSPRPDASPFPRLEPPQPTAEPFELPETRLRTITTHPTWRLAAVALGALCCFVGLLPPSTRAQREENDDG